ncbi:hypothetical protein Tco_0952073 [Tanacetum coccineum]|uniref:Uncharacterized protein n=1 Tax=Tanacetum coccineum TaxID=301880 RepID=A0ABQ5DWL9_9ASTR
MGDINTLTLEKYMALNQRNNRQGIVKPEIGNNVKFEIKSHIIKELRLNLLRVAEDEDAHEHAIHVTGMMEQPLSKEAAITQMTLLLSPIDLIALDVIWRILMRVFMLYKLVARFMKGYIQPKSVLLKNKARENMDLNLRILDAAIKNLEMKVEKVTQAILKNEDNTVNKVKVKIEKVKKVRKMPEYVKYVNDVFSSKEPTNEEDAVTTSKGKRNGMVSDNGNLVDLLNELCGYVPCKPSQDFTRPIGTPSGSKGLLHTLNATVIPTKGNSIVKARSNVH